VFIVTRLNGTIFYLNAELVQSVEQTPDTVITLVSEKKYVVRESAQQVVDEIVAYQQRKRQAYQSPAAQVTD
jgi:flagellar protein FlbD